MRTEGTPHCWMEMKMISLQRAEFKDTLKNQGLESIMDPFTDLESVVTELLDSRRRSLAAADRLKHPSDVLI